MGSAALRMRRPHRLVVVAGLIVAAVASACTAPLPGRDLRSVAREAYLLGAPLVTSVRTMQTIAPVSPVNQLTWQTALAGPEARLVVAPNRDTVYVGGPLDLRAGPMILRVPAIVDRYYTFQFLDAYNTTTASVGTRTNGGRAVQYFVAPRSFTGATPPDMERISPSTLQAMLIGRFAVRDEAEIADVLRYKSSVTLVPYSDTGLAVRTMVPAIGQPSGPPQALRASGVGFFDELGAAMATNPPVNRDGQALMRRMAKVGLGPGFVPTRELSASQQRVVLAAMDDAAREIERASTGAISSAWVTEARLSRSASSFLASAVKSARGWGANLPQETTYAYAVRDSSGAALHGNATYTLTFPAVPNVGAYWSVSVYGPELFFVTNPYGKYHVNSLQSGIVPNPDGTATIVLASSQPSGVASAWIPTPDGPFVVMVRNVLPNGDLVLPRIVRS
jgi:hypothetical protein